MYARNYTDTRGIPVRSFSDVGAYQSFEMTSVGKAHGKDKGEYPRDSGTALSKENVHNEIATAELSEAVNTAEAMASIADDVASLEEKHESQTKSEDRPGLLYRLRDAFSSLSGDTHGGIVTDDLIIIALIALFLLGAEDNEGDDMLVPLALIALMLI